MSVRVPKYTNEEAARLGNGIYERDVRSKMSEEDRGKFVAIDMDSGEWEMDPDEMAACDQLLGRIPDAQVWMTRVGFGYAHRFGIQQAGSHA